MSESRFKVIDVPWYRRYPLVVREPGGWRQVGWVSGQRAYMVNNLSQGWIAFVDDQTPENIDHWFCPNCKAAIWGSQRRKIEAAAALTGDREQS